MFSGPFGQSDEGADIGAAGIDLTAMIDVIFLLIIFWMVLTSFAPTQPRRQIELPSAAVTRATGAGRPIMIDVVAEPIRPIYFLARRWEPAELAEHLASQPLTGRNVVLRVDRRADARLVSRLTRICYDGGADLVEFSLHAAGGGR